MSPCPTLPALVLPVWPHGGRLRRCIGFSADLLRIARRQAFAAHAPATLPNAHLPGQGARRRQPLPARAGDSFCLSGNLEGEVGQHAGALSLGDEPSLAGGHSLGAGLLLRGDAHGPARSRALGEHGSVAAWLWPRPSFAPTSCGSCPSFGRAAGGDRDHRRVREGVAAWGSFRARRGAYAPQPRLAKRSPWP